jgi:hypothetical protein
MAQEPITGLWQWLHWGTASADTPVGVLTGGALPLNPDARSRMGSGGNIMRRGGVVQIGGNATFDVTATNQGLVAAGFRASYPRGALTEVYIAGGADQWGVQHDAAWITQGSINYSQGQGLQASVTWGGLAYATHAGDEMDPEANLSLEDYEFVVSFEGAEYGVTAVTINVSNNCSFKNNANPKAAGQKRWPNVRRYGAEVVTVDLTTDIPLPQATLDLAEDLLPSNLGMVLTGTNGTDSLVVTLTSLQPNNEDFGFVDANSDVAWTYGFNGNSRAGCVDWAWS